MDRRSFLVALGLGSGGLFSFEADSRTVDSTQNAWRRDGSGWRARIGVVTPDNDPVPESEFWTMAPEGVSIHAARMPLIDVKTFSNPPYADGTDEQMVQLYLHAKECNST